MSTLRIPENVLGAFKREFWASAQIGEPEDRSIESGLQAALAECGATEEFQSAWAFGAAECATAEEALDCSDGDDGRLAQVRFVTPWTPVDGGQ
jgi:hypothetical protein